LGQHVKIRREAGVKSAWRKDAVQDAVFKGGQGGTWAAVPLKHPGAAKSRLQSGMSAEGRRGLYFAMARHVLSMLAAAPSITRIAVVTASDEVETLAAEFGALVIREPADGGTAEACETAIDSLAGMGVRRLLLIGGDLPMLTSASVEWMCALLGGGDGVVLAPDRRKLGTNALLCSPPNAIAMRFGPDSYRQHLAETRAAGLPAHIADDEALALDIDELDDLDRLRILRIENPGLLPLTIREAMDAAGCSEFSSHVKG
jgi:2-phospho-L-lactate guanylyltransferase